MTRNAKNTVHGTVADAIKKRRQKEMNQRMIIIEGIDKSALVSASDFRRLIGESLGSRDEQPIVIAKPWNDIFYRWLVIGLTALYLFGGVAVFVFGGAGK